VDVHRTNRSTSEVGQSGSPLASAESGSVRHAPISDLVKGSSEPVEASWGTIILKGH
jgi:hypothetical protein